MIKRLIAQLLIFMMLSPSLGYTQAQPSSMQRALSGILQKKMNMRGFASNDPRWASTLQSAGAQIGGYAATAAVVTAAGITAPAWITVSAAILVGVAIDLAIDGVRWLINGDGSVQYATVNGVPVLPNGKCYKSNVGGSACWGSIVDALTSGNDASTWDFLGTHSYKTQFGSIPGVSTFSVLNGAGQAIYIYSDQIWFADGTPRAVKIADSVGGTSGGTATGSPSAAIATLSDADKAKQVNPALLAQMIDDAWKKASQKPGYTGYPYDTANPITAADAMAWLQANPAAWPQVAALVAPQPAPSGGTLADPFTLPNSAAEPAIKPVTDNPPPETNPTFDWSIPNTGETISKQVVPVSYVPTVFAAPTGCPAPITFTMMGKQYTISYGPFCDLMTALAPIFLACGAAAAAIIFMQSLKS